MSLILRKEAQPLLDAANLSDHHVIIRESSKTLTIVCECGSPLITVHSIKFTKITPTKAEIDYAVTLLNEFLKTNNKIITKFIDDKKKFEKRKVPTQPLSMTIQNYTLRYKYTFGVDDLSFNFNLDKDTLIPKEFSSITDLDPFKLNQAKFDKNEFNKDVSNLVNYLKYEEEKDYFKNMNHVLPSCEV